MKSDAIEKKISAYVPYKTFKNWLRSLTQGVPPRFEKRMFASMSGSTQSQLVQALKALGLMDANWVPSDKLRRLQASVNNESQYRVVLKSVLEDAYPFLSHFDLKGGTLGLLQEEFEKTGATGGTVSKCIAFLIPAAKDAGMEVSAYIEKPSGRAPGAPRAKRATRSAAQRNDPPPPPPPADQHGTVSPLQKMLFDKYPAFDPEWSSEVQAKWFEGFAKLQAALEGKSSK